MEALVGFQGGEVGDVVQLDFCHPSSSNPLFFNRYGSDSPKLASFQKVILRSENL
jgi:hypothetical protein